MRCIRFFLATLTIALPSLAFGLDPNALPTGGAVAAGAASISQAGNRLTVQQQTGKAVLNWNTFNIGSQGAVNFQQPGTSSVVLNRVAGGGISEIHGSLTGNGQVFLVNPAGTLFGRGAQVNVGGLVASTLDIGNDNFMRGHYRFTSGGGQGTIINEGSLSAMPGGYIALLAPQVRNAGVIAAQMGTVAIGAGNAVTLDIGGTGLVSMQVEQSAVDTLIENRGLVQADGGVVYMAARAAGQFAGGVINNAGEVQATRFTERDGVIRLEAGDVANGGTIKADGAEGGRITLASATTTINSGAITARGSEGKGGEVRLLGDKVGLFGTGSVDASGEAGGGIALVGGNFQGKGPEQNASLVFVGPNASVRSDAGAIGNGGKVIVWSDESTTFAGTLTARGGATSGNGGFAEVSGKHALDFGPRRVDLRAPHGAPGTLLLDPQDIVVANSGSATYADVSTFAANSGTTQTIDPATLDAVGGAVTLQATHDITVTDAINLTTPGAGLTAQAGNNIHVNAAIMTSNGPITLSARDPGGSQTGAGTVNLNAGLFTGSAAVTLTNNNGTSAITLGGGISAGAGNVAIASGGLITQTAGTITTGGILTTSSVGGLSLPNANNIATFSATNSGGGNITVDGGQTVSGIAQTGGGAVTLNGVQSITGSISAGSGGTITLTSASSITESGGGLIDTTGVLTTVSAFGQTLNGPNTVGTFNATNSGSGTVSLINTAPTLTLSGISTSGCGACITVGNTGSIAITGTLNTGGGGTVNLSASGGAISESGAGMVIGGPTLVTSSSTGQTLGGTNSIGSFNAVNSTSGFIALNNAAAPLLIAGISNAGTGNVSVNNSGNVFIQGPVTSGTGGVNLTSGGTINETTGTVSTTGIFATSSVGGQSLGGLNTVAVFSGSNAASGSLSLNNSNSTLAIQSISQSGPGNASVSNAGNLIVQGPVVSGSGGVSLTSTGIIVETSGTISTTGALTTSSHNGQTFNGINSVSSLGASITGGGTFEFNNSGPLTVTGISANSGSITVSNAGPLTLTGLVSAGGAVNLTANNGILESGAGRVSTLGTLTTSSGTGQSLNGANAVGSFNATNTGSGALFFTNTAPNFIVTGITQVPGLIASVSNTGNMTTTGPITSGGGISLTATNGIETIGAPVTASGGGFVNLTATGPSGDVVLNADVTSATGGISAMAGRNVRLNAGSFSTASNVSLTGTTGNIVETAAGRINANLLMTSSATGTFLGASNTVNSFKGMNSTSGAVSLVNTVGTLTITGITQAANANVSINNTGALVTTSPISTAGTGNITLTATGTETLGAAITTGGNLTLTGTGVSQTAGALMVGGSTTVNAGTGAVTLNSLANDFAGAVSLTAGPVQIVDANSLAFGTLATAGLSATSTGALDLGQGTVSGALSTASNGGAITQSGPLTIAGAAAVSAGAAAITLNAANDFQGVVTLANSGSGNNVSITDSNTITFSNQVLGGAFTVTAPTIIAHDTTNTGNQTWAGNVTFNSTETTNGGSFTVTGTTTLGNGLTVNAGSGDVTFQGAVNGTQSLSVNTTGTTAFNGAVSPTVSVFVNGVVTGAAAAAPPATVAPVVSEPAAVAAVAAVTALTSPAADSTIASGPGGSSPSSTSTSVALSTVAAAAGPAPAPLTAGTSTEAGTTRLTVSSGTSRETIRQIDQQIAAARTQMFSSALNQLVKDPSAADVPDCSAGMQVGCVQSGKPRKDISLADADPQIKRRIAVLFGNDRYLAPIPALQTPIRDVEDIGRTLKDRLGYDVRVVRNASKQDIVKVLNELVTTVDEEDSVIVYYAGHGYQAEKEKGGGGYWIPVDANNNDASTWISNSAISKFLSNMASRQVLLISDSCYSGTLAQEQKVRTTESTVFDRKEILRKRSVLVMSSGGNEPVADGGHDNHSLFAYHLLRSLNQVEGDLVGGDIHERVRTAVMREYPQDPQYGAVVTAGHSQGGEYLIEKK